MIQQWSFEDVDDACSLCSPSCLDVWRGMFCAWALWCTFMPEHVNWSVPSSTLRSVYWETWAPTKRRNTVSKIWQTKRCRGIIQKMCGLYAECHEQQQRWEQQPIRIQSHSKSVIHQLDSMCYGTFTKNHFGCTDAFVSTDFENGKTRTNKKNGNTRDRGAEQNEIERQFSQWSCRDNFQYQQRIFWIDTRCTEILCSRWTCAAETVQYCVWYVTPYVPLNFNPSKHKSHSTINCKYFLYLQQFKVLRQNNWDWTISTRRNSPIYVSMRWFQNSSVLLKVTSFLCCDWYIDVFLHR